ncbi:glutathione S-transferase family protein [Achromobacter sp. GG226]|uniref:glutathione S-transferase family protein n=1 Tax=Verticiella alkaliphila TaxID=2779529 RepID=UPI001C0BFA4F|nr:glutathione S-transferase family protein [Verticiella sp. GG226]
MLTLYIGNKNYSSWSMRPWVLMKQAGIPFDEVVVRFDGFEPQSQFKQRMAEISPVGKVPVLEDDGLRIWDSLAIAEYLAERFPRRQLWPADVPARALARAACADMHSGFTALRSHLPMNIEASLAAVGERVLREQPAVVADVRRLESLWLGLLEAHGGPLLFGAFSIADAFFAPVASRMRTYAVPLHPDVQRYVDRVLALPGVVAWVDDAVAEHDFRPFEEPYRQAAP